MQTEFGDPAFPQLFCSPVMFVANSSLAKIALAKPKNHLEKIDG